MSKSKSARYTVDFVTALPPALCRERLDRPLAQPPVGLYGQWLPISQQVILRPDGSFIVERFFPGALKPIRFSGCLDDDQGSGGTWVHGAVTHDTENQVWIEGLLVFLAFFFISALLFVRVKDEAFFVSIPLLLIMLGVMSLRWRALGRATAETAHWVRRVLYVTGDQFRSRPEPQDSADSAETPGDQASRARRAHRGG